MREQHLETEWLFGGDNDPGAWEANRRFISETFNPIYRQGVIGPHHLPEADFADFLLEVQTDTAAAAERLRAWILRDRPHGGDFGDLIMDRIAARAPGFDAKTASGVTRLFAEFMDEYYRIRPKAEVFIDIWQQSSSILRAFRASVPGFSLGEISDALAKEGDALAWMTCSIGRAELWAHGLAGNRKRDQSEQLLTKGALQKFLTQLIDRMEELGTEVLLSFPQLMSVLYTLKESPWNRGKADAVVNRLAGPSVSEEDFLIFLEATAGTIISSNRGAYRHISISTLNGLLGENVFEDRWAEIVGKSPPALRDRVARIQKLIDDGRD